MLKGKEEQRDICSIGLKTVVVEMPASMGFAAVTYWLYYTLLVLRYFVFTAVGWCLRSSVPSAVRTLLVPCGCRFGSSPLA